MMKEEPRITPDWKPLHCPLPSISQRSAISARNSGLWVSPETKRDKYCDLLYILTMLRYASQGPAGQGST